jgi:transposase
MSNIKPRNNQGLFAEQAQVVEALMETPRYEDAAAQVGVSRATIFRWLKDDRNFRLAMNEAEEQRLGAATRKLVSNYVLASEVLERALRGETVTARELRAADLVLKHLPNLLQAVALHSRLGELERRLGPVDYE